MTILYGFVLFYITRQMALADLTMAILDRAQQLLIGMRGTEATAVADEG